MNTKTLVSYALKSISAGKLRTALTLLAIGIGAFSIFLLTGISNGIKEEVLKTSSSLGNDLVIVVPTKVTGNAFLRSRRQNFVSFQERFTESDVNKVRGIQGIERAAGGLTALAEVNYSKKQTSVNVVGFQRDYEGLIPSIKVAEGRWFSSKKEVVLGSNVAEDTFSKRIRPGDSIYIEGRKFRVAGILQKTGNALARVDDRIIMDISTFREVFPDLFAKDEIAVIIAKTSEGYDVEEVGKRVEQLLSLRKGGNDTFTVVTPKFIKKQVDDLLGVLQSFFIAVAGMALLVGLVGVSNTVYMNVIDRMKEIALLKTLGTQNKTVVFLFVFEGAFLSFSGIFLGGLFATLIGFLQPFIPFSPDLLLVEGASVVIVIASAIAAYFPARYGASISPTEALRYE